MKTMHTNRTFLSFACRAAAFGALAVITGNFALAQTLPSPATPLLVASAAAPSSLVLTPDAGYGSSSSSNSSSSDSLSAARSDLSATALDSTQPPPRRRYGRPNYADNHTNADGSSKFGFMAGVGAAIPTQDTGNYLDTSYAFQVGAGRNFSKTLSLMAQFDYNHFGFQGSTLANQQSLYNFGVPASEQISGLDGTSHIWSFTLDPQINFHNTERSGAYVVGGVGFYHKTANFTVPATGEYCDPYYGCYEYAANETIHKYTSNAVGFNGGLGLTYKPSRFAGERFYMEARYVYVDNQPKAATVTNYYPPNANQSYYIPITFGLRF